MSNDAWRALEGHRAKVAQYNENATRAARVYARYTTTGLGALAEQAVFAFDVAFLDMPIFSVGAALGDDVPLSDIVADYPTYQATVYEWRVDGDGCYTGAWCYFVVSAGSSVDASTFTLDFTLSWSGVASKNFIASPQFPMSALQI